MTTERENLWKKQIEEVRADPNYTEEERKNIISNYELFILLDQHKAEGKARIQAKAKLLRLKRSITNRKEQLAKMEKEYDKLLFDDKVFTTYAERQRWIMKHEKREE